MLSPAPTVLWLFTGVAQPECSFHYQRPAPLVDPGNDNSFGLAAINDFLRGFADTSGWVSSRFTSALSSFWLGLPTRYYQSPVLHLTLRQNCRRAANPLFLRSGNQLG